MKIGLVVSEKTMFSYVDGSPTLEERSKVNLEKFPFKCSRKQI